MDLLDVKDLMRRSAFWLVIMGSALIGIAQQSALPVAGSGTLPQASRSATAPVHSATDVHTEASSLAGQKDAATTSIEAPSAVLKLERNPIGWREKAKLASTNFVDPYTFAASALDAGVSTALDPHSPYGPGARGWARHFGVGVTDELSGEFFQTFLIPSLFGQNPCYHFSESSNPWKRTGHAAAHAFVAHSDSGSLTWNAGELLGTVATASLGNTYHLGRKQGFVPTATRIGISIGWDSAFNVFHEFYPDLAKKMHIRKPFLRHMINILAE